MADVIVRTNVENGSRVTTSVSSNGNVTVRAGTDASVQTSVEQGTEVKANIAEGIKVDAGVVTGAPGPQGPPGDQGEPGPQGNPGAGVPTGGVTGQVPVKQSNLDYDIDWADIIAGVDIGMAIGNSPVSQGMLYVDSFGDLQNNLIQQRSIDYFGGAVTSQQMSASDDGVLRLGFVNLSGIGQPNGIALATDATTPFTTYWLDTDNLIPYAAMSIVPANPASSFFGLGFGIGGINSTQTFFVSSTAVTTNVPLNMSSNLISNLSNPLSAQDAATKVYVDGIIPSQSGHAGEFLSTDGSTLFWDTVAAGGGIDYGDFLDTDTIHAQFIGDPAQPVVIGVTASGGSSVSSGTQRKRVSKFTVTDTGLLDDITVRFWYGSGSGDFRGLVYSDNAGAPDELLAVTPDIVVSDNTETAQTISFVGSNRINLKAGDVVWIGGQYSGSGIFSIDGTSNGHNHNPDSFSDGATNPFGSATVATGVLSAAITVLKPEAITFITQGYTYDPVTFEFTMTRGNGFSGFDADGRLLSGLTDADSVVIGTNAGNINASTGFNTFIGTSAGSSVTSGTQNVALGGQALLSLTTGNFNFALGSQAGKILTTGSNNIFIGIEAGKITGTNVIGNIGIGSGAASQVEGNYSVAIGDSAARNTTAGAMTVIGTTAGYEAGDNTVAIGYSAGYQAGSGGVYVGYFAGQAETGDNKLYIHNSNSATPLIYGDFSSRDLVFNGDVVVDGYDLEVTGSAKGLILESPDSTRWRISVSDLGVLTASAV